MGCSRRHSTCKLYPECRDFPVACRRDERHTTLRVRSCLAAGHHRRYRCWQCRRLRKLDESPNERDGPKPAKHVTFWAGWSGHPTNRKRKLHSSIPRCLALNDLRSPLSRRTGKARWSYSVDATPTPVGCTTLLVLKTSPTSSHCLRPVLKRSHNGRLPRIVSRVRTQPRWRLTETWQRQHSRLRHSSSLEP